MRRMLVASLLLCPIASLPMQAAGQPADEWRDPSPHSTTMVTVEPGVELEVLDWGGSGRPVLLLAGLGDSAHIFDDFAPTLTGRHRVYALSRRGFGESSAPETGYSFDRLAEDIVAVVHALKLEKPLIAGHSLAGEEMHVLGSRYASEVAGLVYIDAAFDRGAGPSDYEARLRAMPPQPRPGPDDARSIVALGEFNRRNGLAQFPEAAMRARFVVDAQGAITGQSSPAPAVRQGMTAAMAGTSQDYHPARLQVPALALYAAPTAAADLMRPWYDRTDPALQQKVDELYAAARAQFERNAEWFHALASPSSRAIAVPGQHHLFVTNPATVSDEIEAFAAALD